LVDGAGTGSGRAMVSREAAGWRLDAGFWGLESGEGKAWVDDKC
jgi:hypothetical protein